MYGGLPIIILNPPFSNKRLNSIFQSLGFKNIGLTLFSLLAFVLAYFLISGYQYRIIKSSLNDVEVPPEFNA